ncbi:MAG TPA: GNAT family N-acetyltransferase [Clostridiales bacterium]|nr:GNAT family N-acetyltransferase [Clostridiales bacterium]
MISVRKAIIDDIDDIINFLSSLGYSDTDIYKDKDFFVYYENSLLLGCGTAYSTKDYCIIDNIVVDVKHRRNKIGTALVKTILNYYEINGAKKAFALNGCYEFWKSLGFQILKSDEQPELIKNIKDFNESNDVLYYVNLEGYFKNCC